VPCIIIRILLHVLVNKKICTGNSCTRIVLIGSIEVKKGVSPPWYNYFLCGLKGVLEVLQHVSVGMLVAVTGSVPQSSGLSSSSALVSAAALATAHANNVCM
jgi:galactokinase